MEGQLNVGHPSGSQKANALVEPVPLNRGEIVQVHGAEIRQTVVGSQPYFGIDLMDGPG
jgi:hypothetical protein